MCSNLEHVSPMFLKLTLFNNPAALGYPLVGATWEDAKNHMHATIARAKLFVCLGSAWDFMLGEAEVSKKQRKVDAATLKATVASNCESTFPASLMELVDRWAGGGRMLPLPCLELELKARGIDRRA